MKRSVMVLFALVFVSSSTGCAQRQSFEIENSSALMSIDLAGGSIADFHLKTGAAAGLNPFTWNQPKAGDVKSRSFGHFICFDRWGPSTQAEIDNGMGWHGEATTAQWQIGAKMGSKQDRGNGVVGCTLPMAQMEMVRSLQMGPSAAAVRVTETAKNLNKLGRLYNLVQHATMGAPFLSEQTRVYTNVKKGFTQEDAADGGELQLLYWPRIVHDGQMVDLSTFEKPGPVVLTFLCNEQDEHGWIAAVNTEKGLLVGYVWDRADYPWLNMWRSFHRGKPAAFGIEFGTTGLHQPYPVLVERHEIFGTQLYEYLDAGESRSKSYIVFLAELPQGYNGVKDVQVKAGELIVIENSQPQRQIEIPVP